MSPEDDMVRVLLARKGRLLAFLEERVGSRADAEDQLQSAMLRVMTKGRGLRDRDRVISWFCGACRSRMPGLLLPARPGRGIWRPRPPPWDGETL